MEGDPLGDACKYIAEENSTPHSAGSFKFENLPMKFQKP
jgi:hypothetical protein